MAKCGTCGNKTPQIDVTPRSTTVGIKSSKQSRLMAPKPIIQNVARSASIPLPLVTKLAERGNSNACPLCGSGLMPITQTQANKTMTFLQCVSNKCDYKRKP